MKIGNGKTRLFIVSYLSLALLAILPTSISFACFSPATSFLTGGLYPYSVAIGNLNINTDTYPDLAVANYSSNTVSIFLGNGDGTFAAATPATISVGAGPISVAIGDLNGDTKPDLVVANYGNDNISIFLGVGDGTFTPASPATVAVGTSPAYVAIGDLNHTTDAGAFPDLAVANYGSNNVSILTGNGDGTFAAATNFAVGTGPYSVAIGDLNITTDALPDLAVGNYGSNNVSILLGDGLGSFGAATNFAAGSGPYSVAIGDLDGDLDADLAVANGTSNNVSILLGDGLGGFGAATNFAVGTTPTSVAIGDLDGDGNLDLAVANYGGTTVSILKGNGSGGFGAATNLAAGSGPAAVAIGDLDGNTTLDLVVVNHTSNDVSILLNKCPDLLMTNVIPNTPTANQGGTLSISDTVKNQGLVGSGVFRIGYYFSLDPGGATHDVAISTIRVVISLGAGLSNNATTSLSIPSNAPGGTYYLCAKADSVNQVAETDEGNNTLCSGGTVTLPKADLLMTAVSTATTVIAPGKTLSLSNSVKNQGGFSAGSFKIGFFLSVNSDGSTQDVAITTTRTLSSLAAGATSTVSTTLTIPSTALLGTYYVCAEADSGHAVPETSETNNTLCTGSTLQVTLPDLTMTAPVTLNAATANPGGTLSVTDTVSNLGASSGAFRIGYYFSLDPGGATHDVVITTTRTLGLLAAGASSTGTTSLTLPGSTPLGTYYVCTLADSLNQVIETNEGNNTLCSGATVNVVP